MSRIVPNSIDRSVLTQLNDRENIRKLVKSREFNLERQKELRNLYLISGARGSKPFPIYLVGEYLNFKSSNNIKVGFLPGASYFPNKERGVF